MKMKIALFSIFAFCAFRLVANEIPKVTALECGGPVSIWATFDQDTVMCDAGSGACPVWLGWAFQCSTDLKHWIIADFPITVAGTRDIYIVVPRLKPRMFFRAYHP